jgi:hypothetical protein
LVQRGAAITNVEFRGCDASEQVDAVRIEGFGVKVRFCDRGAELAFTSRNSGEAWTPLHEIADG